MKIEQNPKLRQEIRICEKCGKQYTINTIASDENFSKYPHICLYCQDIGLQENLKISNDTEKNKGNS